MYFQAMKFYLVILLKKKKKQLRKNHIWGHTHFYPEHTKKAVCTDERTTAFLKMDINSSLVQHLLYANDSPPARQWPKWVPIQQLPTRRTNWSFTPVPSSALTTKPSLLLPVLAVSQFKLRQPHAVLGEGGNLFVWWEDTAEGFRSVQIKYLEISKM